MSSTATTTSTSRASSSSTLLPRHRITTRLDGDFADPARFDADTTWLRQVHGTTVVEVTAPGQHAAAEADAAFTRVPGARLVVRTADCVPIVLEGRGVVGVVHAGWKGLAAGIIGATIDAMDGDVVRAHIGPHIRAGCYEFGPTDLDVVVGALGEHIRGITNWGTPALDLVAGVRRALGGVPTIEDTGACTACGDIYFSWRARKETARFATIAWMS